MSNPVRTVEPVTMHYCGTCTSPFLFTGVGDVVCPHCEIDGLNRKMEALRETLRKEREACTCRIDPDGF